MGFLIKPVDMSEEAKAKMRKQAINNALAIWQNNNCSRCKFAESKKVGTGEPCCTRPGGPEPKGAICLARRE